MKLGLHTRESWEHHVLNVYPHEACAFVVDGQLWPVPNISATPETTFKVDVVERLMAHKAGEVQAFLHSHPYKLEDTPFEWSPEWATSADMESWMADNIPWGIVATDGEGLSQIVWYDDSVGAIPPLEGREFISGIQDCYSIIRDYYRLELSILLPNYARGMGWWDNGDDLYLRNFQNAGFTEVPLEDIRVNDVLLMTIGGGVVSHAAVVVEQNIILHHLIRRLSGKDTLSKWYRQVVSAIRYKGRAE